MHATLPPLTKIGAFPIVCTPYILLSVDRTDCEQARLIIGLHAPGATVYLCRFAPLVVNLEGFTQMLRCMAWTWSRSNEARCTPCLHIIRNFRYKLPAFSIPLCHGEAVLPALLIHDTMLVSNTWMFILRHHPGLEAG